MNYFALFEIPVAYKIDEAALTKTYLRKQSQVHPDVDESRREESADLNIAYKALLNPLDRAKHFLEIRANYDDLDKLDSESALEAFDLREKYESLAAPEDKKKFQDELRKRISELIATLYNLEDNLDEFRENYALARFVDSFLKKVKLDVYSWN